MRGRAALLFLIGLLFTARPVLSEETFRAEVLSLEGTVTATGVQGGSRAVKQGDLLEAGETLTSGERSYADLAYDKDWQNIARLEADSRIKIASIVPVQTNLEKGAVFAKLKKLPQDSSFEVKTPTAVATVRGTDYRTVFVNGQTAVFNASSSKIYVVPVMPDGSLDRDKTVILRESKKTLVEEKGASPSEPEDMTEDELNIGKQALRAIQKNIDKAVSEERVSQIQSVTEVETFIREEKRKKIAALAATKKEEFSRVTDSRRRTFGGEKASADSEEAPPEGPPNA